MPEGNDEVEPVVFRKWRTKEGGILALFPAVAATMEGHCLSYEHVGGHGGADYRHCLRSTRPASPAEYADLKEELETHYGYKLRVVKRVGCRVHEKRREAARSTT